MRYPFGNITSQNLVRPGGDAPLGFNFTRTFTSASQTLNRNRVLATLDGFQFSYDANGNTLAYTGKLGLGAGGWWDERNRMVVHVAGQPHTAAARPVEYYRYDSGGLRWMRRDSKGVVHLMLRSAAGQAQTEYVLPPGAAAPKLDREYVNATGGVAVERVRAAEALKVVGGVHTTGATSRPFRVPNVQLGTQVMVDIRTPNGPGAQLRNVLLDSQGRFTVNDSLFVPGVTNYLRVKEEGNQRSPWSAPVAVQLNGETTSSSANQIRSISVSRSATNIIVRWGLLSENGRTTNVYFKRADTGALVSLTPQGLNASVREFSLQIQALAIPCGAFYASQAGGGLPESPMIGVDNPTFHEGLGGAVLNNIECGGGGTNPPDPEPEEPVFLTYYHHRDHLGSDRVVTDESGAAVSFHNYYPFGQEMAGGGTMGRFKFTGHERDEETGLDYMKARFFNGPSFLSVDPLGASAVLSAPQTWNRYSYVSGDPISKNDPQGLVEDPRTGGTMYDPSETKWKQPRSRFSRIEERGATQLTPESPSFSLSEWLDVLSDAAKETGKDLAKTFDITQTGSATAFSVSAGEGGRELTKAVAIDAGRLLNVCALAKGISSLVSKGISSLGQTLAPKATSGGANAVRLGQEGEATVRSVAEIGPKVRIEVGGRIRIPDGLSSTTLTEVKNVESLSYTQQLRDFSAYANQNGLRFDLWVRPSTQLSGPLTEQVGNGAISLRVIP